jgi:hypothetical protein
MKKHLVVAVCLSVAIAIDAKAGGALESQSTAKARDALMKYYNVPTQSRKVEVAEGGRAVTVCTDDCERFEVGSKASAADVWDAVVLFKAFMSKTMIDDAFLNANERLANEVLRQRSGSKCGTAKTSEHLASCALMAMTKTAGLKMTRVVYDEGNKCESTWSFGQPQKLLSKRCIKAMAVPK